MKSVTNKGLSNTTVDDPRPRPPIRIAMGAIYDPKSDTLELTTSTSIISGKGEEVGFGNRLVIANIATQAQVDDLLELMAGWLAQDIQHWLQEENGGTF